MSFKEMKEIIENKVSYVHSHFWNICDTPWVLFGVIIIINVIGVILNWDGWCSYFSFDFSTSTGRDIVNWLFVMMKMLFPQVFLSVLWYVVWLVCTEHFWDGEL